MHQFILKWRICISELKLGKQLHIIILILLLVDFAIKFSWKLLINNENLQVTFVKLKAKNHYIHLNSSMFIEHLCCRSKCKSEAVSQTQTLVIGWCPHLVSFKTGHPTAIQMSVLSGYNCNTFCDELSLPIGNDM